MSGLSFTVTLYDAKPLAALAQVEDALDDLTVLFDGIGRALVNSAVERIIQTNTGPDGAAWEPSQRVKDHGGKTLHDTGELSRSITHLAGPDRVVVGTNRPYARAMQVGAERGEFGAAIGRTTPTAQRPWSQDYFTPLPWGDIPARPYLGISSDDLATIGDLVELHISQIVGALQ